MASVGVMPLIQSCAGWSNLGFAKLVSEAICAPLRTTAISTNTEMESTFAKVALAAVRHVTVGHKIGLHNLLAAGVGEVEGGSIKAMGVGDVGFGVARIMKAFTWT